MTHFFAQTLTVSDALIFEIFHLEKVGQGHGVKHSHWRHLTANIKIYKIRVLQILATSRRFLVIA